MTVKRQTSFIFNSPMLAILYVIMYCKLTTQKYVIMYCKLTTQKYTNVTVLFIKHSQKSQQQYQLESLCVIVAESQVSENSLGCNVLSVVDRSVNSESVCHHSAHPLNCKPTERNPIAVERSLYDVLLPVPCSLYLVFSETSLHGSIPFTKRFVK